MSIPRDSYVITDKCLGERYALCVAACPMDCIHPIDYKDKPFMVIDPEECISCGLCYPECPVDAIVTSQDQAPEYAEINQQLTPAAIQFEQTNGKVEPRPYNDPPRNPENQK